MKPANRPVMAKCQSCLLSHVCSRVIPNPPMGKPNKYAYKKYTGVSMPPVSGRRITSTTENIPAAIPGASKTANSDRFIDDLSKWQKQVDSRLPAYHGERLVLRHSDHRNDGAIRRNSTREGRNLSVWRPNQHLSRNVCESRIAWPWGK